MTAPRAAALHHGAYWTEAIGLGVLTNPFGPVAILHTKGGPLPYTGTPVPVTSPAAAIHHEWRGDTDNKGTNRLLGRYFSARLIV